jgi:hypothetical protein
MMKHVCIPDDVAHGYIHSYIIHHLLDSGRRQWRQSKEPPRQRCASAISADSESADRQKREALLLLSLSSLSFIAVVAVASHHQQQPLMMRVSDLRVSAQPLFRGESIRTDRVSGLPFSSFGDGLGLEPRATTICGVGPRLPDYIVNGRHRRGTVVGGLALNHVSTEGTTLNPPFRVPTAPEL